ncbi:DUF7577 domain-containing protein [Halococcus agarilyticus]|uniref:DUF7577 domain-containing protein n=1 Tax=Halococcus agarilyticus TaxID=1232219 RepID=UPI00067769E7|nr:hypothetical protein [Halococcus agarilyticus]
MMAVWGVAMLVVLPLLQFPLILYLSRRVDADEESLPPVGWGDDVYPPDPDVSQPADGESPGASTPDRSSPSTPSAPSAASTPPESPVSSTPSVVVCRRCDAENDPTFTYCHDCVARL